MLLRYIDTSRYSPVVVVPGYLDDNRSSPKRFIEEVQELGVPLIRPSDPGNIWGVNFVKDVYHLSQELRKAKIEVAHIHTARPFGARRATVAVRVAGVPALLRTEHLAPSATITPYTKYFIKHIEWLTDCIITDSDSCRNEQINLLGRNPDKVKRYYCGIELDRFNPLHDKAAAKRKLNLDPTIPMVGAIGRLAEQKGHTYLVTAAARIIKEFGPVNFVLVGNGPLEEMLRQQVAALGIGEYFHFAGFQPNTIPYMEAMDVAVMPSLYEGFSLAMLEFMAMGKPMVTSDEPSFTEAMTDGESCLMAPKRDGKALGEAILKVLRNPELANQLSQNALKRVRTDFGMPRLASDMMDLYDSLLGIKTVSHTQNVGEAISYR